MPTSSHPREKVEHEGPFGFLDSRPEAGGSPSGSVHGGREEAGRVVGASTTSSLAMMSRARSPELASGLGVSSAPVEGFGFGTEESCPYSLPASFSEESFISSNLFFELLKRSSLSGIVVSRCSFLQPSPREQVRFFAGL